MLFISSGSWSKEFSVLYIWFGSNGKVWKFGTNNKLVVKAPGATPQNWQEKKKWNPLWTPLWVSRRNTGESTWGTAGIWLDKRQGSEGGNSTQVQHIGIGQVINQEGKQTLHSVAGNMSVVFVLKKLLSVMWRLQMNYTLIYCPPPSSDLALTICCPQCSRNMHSVTMCNEDEGICAMSSCLNIVTDRLFFVCFFIQRLIGYVFFVGFRWRCQAWDSNTSVRWDRL